MALVACPECNNDVSQSAKTCPSCGFRLRRTVWPYYVIGGAAVFVVCLMGFGWLASFSNPANRSGGGMDEVAYDRSLVVACWEEYNKQSLPPSMKARVAALCEDREKEFVAYHGFKP